MRAMPVLPLRVLLLAGALALGGCASTPRPTATPPFGGAAVPSPVAADVVLAALAFLDRPYARGGDGDAAAQGGFDCSGFTRHVYAVAAGLQLPRRAEEQARAPGWTTIGRDALQPGDLVFFDTLSRPFSHVGLYVGDGRFVHAPRVGAQVRVEDMRLDYWARRFDGARRAPVTLPPQASAERSVSDRP
jgi:cell wall-associated NlpC family hydrolase